MARAVRAGARHRLVGVGHREDARLERNLLAAEAERVAAAVQPLVVGEDPLGNVAAGPRRRGCARPSSGCLRISAHSSSSSGPGFRRIASLTPILPTSWSTPASAIRSTSGCGRPSPMAVGPRVAAHALRVLCRCRSRGGRWSRRARGRRTADPRPARRRPAPPCTTPAITSALKSTVRSRPSSWRRRAPGRRREEGRPRSSPSSGKAGHADAHRQRRRRVHEGGLHRAPEPLAHEESVVLGGLGQHQRELLAPQPRGQVDAAGEPGHLAGEALQHLVAARMPEAVVHALEVVQVGHEQAHRPLAAPGALQLELQRVLECRGGCSVR